MLLPYRIRIANGPGFARARLPVGEDGRVEAIQAALYERLGRETIHLFLGRIDPEHMIEVEAAAVPGNHLRDSRRVYRRAVESAK